MDKYEYKIRADEIKELIAQGEYVQAAEIADTIDWRRVKSVMMLCTISDLYKINRRFEDARDMLLLAYERRPGGRTICYSLCELSIKMEEFIQAVEYYKEFVQIAPRDSGRYILQYKLYEAQDVSLEERIEVLEELKRKDYREKWAYELAYLYHRVGLGTRCVEECDELILWFGEGKYVVKAMELKMLHQPLNPEQQEKYDHRFDAFVNEAAVSSGEGYGEEGTAEQEAADAAVYADAAAYPYEPAYQESGADYVQEQEYASEEAYGGEIYDARSRFGNGRNYGDMESAVSEELQPQAAAEELDIHVKTVDVGQYNTINLQAELAEGLKEVLNDPEVDAPEENILEDETKTAEEIQETEVFFGETEEIGDLNLQTGDMTEMILPEEEMPESTVPDITGEIVMEQMRRESTEAGMEEVLHAEPPRELAGVLAQEGDGQISLVMPESDSLEKQITGQMDIQEVLAEWERMKKENQEKRENELRRHVLEQTGNMFTEFEASVRDGLLEQLESGKQSLPESTAVPDPDVDEIPEEADDADEVEELEKIEEPEELEEAPGFSGEEAAEEPEEAPGFSGEEAAEEPEEAPAPFEEEAAEESEEAPAPFEEEAVGETDGIPGFFEEETEEAETESGHLQKKNEDRGEKESGQESGPEIVRDKARVRSLTREERELYAPFIQSRSAREQLVNAVDNISMAAYAGNVIITGEEGMDTLTLAKNMIREVQMTDSNFSGKVAKISGQALNQREVKSTIGQLKNGALIIRKASGMNEKTVGELHKCLQQEHLGIIVVLEDTKKAMDRLLAAGGQLFDSFSARMDVEALSNDTLVAFGRQYAREMEYSIDELGVLALHTRIEDLQTIDHVVTVVEVKQIVDEAIHHANKKTIKHFFDILFARRYDEEDMIILSENDFA